MSLASELQDSRQDGDRLRAHTAGLETRFDASATSGPPGSESTRTRRAWSAAEDRRLIELAAQGLPVSQVATHLDRGYWTVWRR